MLRGSAGAARRPGQVLVTVKPVPPTLHGGAQSGASCGPIALPSGKPAAAPGQGAGSAPNLASFCSEATPAPRLF